MQGIRKTWSAAIVFGLALAFILIPQPASSGPFQTNAPGPHADDVPAYHAQAPKETSLQR